jgi:ribosomal protein S18 acetylase RimI-like enzyme
MIVIQQLDQSQINLVADLDRSEHVTVNYLYDAGQLAEKTVDWQVPRWSEEHAAHHIQELTPMLAAGGLLFGAFDGDQLAGIAILRLALTETMAQLAFLHVNRDYRRMGVARRFTEEMVRLAREDGAIEMYVSATPSGSAVGFYTSQGFKVAPPERIHPELFEKEPEDIHLIKVL